YQRSLQSNGLPPAILFNVHASEPVIAAVVPAILFAPLDRSAGDDGGTAVHPYVQIGDLARVVVKRARFEAFFYDLRFRAQLAAERDEGIVVGCHALQGTSVPADDGLVALLFKFQDLVSCAGVRGRGTGTVPLGADISHQRKNGSGDEHEWSHFEP